MAVPVAPWQLECEKMEQRCGYLLTSGLWSDCTFMVGSETDPTMKDQTAVPAHKLVLAMASPVFEAMLYGGLSDLNEPVVQIPDVQPETFKALLQYIYTGNTDIDSFDMAWDLWYGAKKYMLPRLINKCNSYICSVLGPNNACKAYEFACLFDEKTLMDKCIKIISTNTKEVLNDSGFVNVQLKTVLTVCSLDQLNVDSELDLFNAVARYAEAERKRQGQCSPHVDEGLPSEELSEKLSSLSIESSAPIEMVTSKQIDNKKNLEEEKPTIRGALQKIRFLSLTVQQFAEGPAVSGLLTDAESNAIFVNKASRKSSMKMPTGFSECRAPRSDSMNQCFKAGCLEHITKALKCGIHVQVEEGAISKLIALLGRGGKVATKAAWVLGTIVYGKPNIRDKVLNLGALPAMLPYMHSNTPSTQLETYLWAYRNMCLGYDKINVCFELVSPALPHITELLVNQATDPRVLSLACMALLSLTYSEDTPEVTIQAILGLTKHLINLLKHPALQVQIEALKVFGNLLYGTDAQIDRCLETGCWDHIINFLKCDKSVLLKEEAARAVRNSLGKSPLQIKKALEKPILMPLIELLSEKDGQCQCHAAAAFKIICVHGTVEQLDVLVSAGFLEPYCLLLSSPDNPLVVIVLNGLSNLLQKVGQITRLAVCVQLREIGVPQVLITLQQHDDEKIRLQASHLMETYFPDAVPSNA